MNRLLLPVGVLWLCVSSVVRGGRLRRPPSPEVGRVSSYVVCPGGPRAEIGGDLTGNLGPTRSRTRSHAEGMIDDRRARRSARPQSGARTQGTRPAERGSKRVPRGL